MADQTEPVHFFDLTSALEGPRQSWSPNTLKTRAILNYKGIKYTQSWISYPDIAPISKALEIPANLSGTVYYTLPAIVHKASVSSNPHGAMHDSFPIALHLDKAFPAPEYPSIFPNGQASIALAIATEKLLTASVAKFVRMLFAGVSGILDDRGKEYFSDTRLPRFQTRYPDIQSMAELRPASQEECDTIVADTNKELQIFSTLLEGQAQNAGPFLEGEKPAYADFVLAAYLAWYERSNPEVFDALLESSNGLLRKHWEASQPFINGQGVTIDWAVPKP
ncbi:hypothetical protein UA08_07279 [Talaromyces atroroseus]|uniref:GST C-terminal domain-containing protein n=1 Tax=Talaromyces atroroseus TaxID=1441469 RepID=A0A225AHY2_TALAT|nr:hypothetical protein UA08_07279 [Talaromyces atroroseus]OKL57824.1 hypothetical protein UA08_07279 [Talaromyces atroroseus]